MSSPWSLAHAFAGAGGLIRPGDVVLLRGGTYRAPTGLRAAVAGTPDAPITFSAYACEVPVVDGAISEFQTVDNDAWEPVEVRPGHNVYRSAHEVTPRASLPAYGGLIAIDGQLYPLAVHRDIAYLQSDVHVWTETAMPRYVGPGIAYDATSKRIYIRLDNSTPEAQHHRDVRQIADPDPRNNELHIAAREVVGLTVRGSHLRFERIHFRGSYVCWTFARPRPDAAPPTDVIFTDCAGEPHYFVARLGGATNIKVLGGTYDGHMHSAQWWVAGEDIKGRDEPAKHVRKCAFDLGASSNVELGPSPDGTRMIIRQFFDGILAEGALKNINVHGIWFDEIWDDAWQQYANMSNVEYHDNVHFGAGPSRDGSVSRVTPEGTVYIHDNVIDTTVHRFFWFRGGPAHGGVPVTEAIPLSSHQPPAATAPAWPWKLYHNTIYTGLAPRGTHLGIAHFGANQTPGQAQHEVYNNIVVTVDGRPLGRDFYATSGLEVYDGNCLWSGDRWAARNGPHRFIHTSAGRLGVPGPPLKSLADMKSSQAYRDSQAYYAPGWENSGIEVDPALDGAYRPTTPAVRTGAVDLTAKAWPGVGTCRVQRGARLTTPFPPAPFESPAAAAGRAAGGIAEPVLRSGPVR